MLFIFIWGFAVWIYEQHSRGLMYSRGLSAQHILRISRGQSEGAKVAYSNEICSLVGCDKRNDKIIVAYQEVQARLRLDDRFIVRSLDGIVDYKLSDYIDNYNCIRHLDYIRDRSVDLLMEFPDYSKGVKCRQSLKKVHRELVDNGFYKSDGIEIKAIPFTNHLGRTVVVGQVVKKKN
jgi:hypothetical protein